MELFKKRPLALICFLSISIMVTAQFLNHTFRTILLCTVGLTTLISVIITIYLSKKRAPSRLIKSLVCFVIFLSLTFILFGRMSLSVSKRALIDKVNGKSVHITGSVNQVLYNSDDFSALDVTLSSIDGESCSIRATITFEEYLKINESDTFSLVNYIYSLSGNDEYLRADGFYGTISCSSESELSYQSVKSKGSVMDIFKNANDKIQDVLNSITDEKTGALTGALLLGNRSGLRDEIIRDFHRCGISHMLALSGLHMCIIMGFFDFVLRSLFVNKKIRCVVLSIFAVSYLALTGFSASASRAVIMLCIVYFTYILSSDAESTTSLFVALTLILIISPLSIYDVGLWLSFCATLGIITVSELTAKFNYHLKKKPLHIRILTKITLSIVITVAAVFSVSLLTWLFFGEISLLSPLTNLIFSPIMTAIIVLGLITVIFAHIPFVSAITGKALVLLCSAFEETASYISHLRGITVSLKYDFVPYIIIPLCISFVIFLLIKVRRKWIITIPPCLAITAFAISLSVYNSSNAQKGSLLYIKDYRNESLILSTVDQTSICDISGGGYYTLRGACELAIEEGATEIENIVITHYHDYHSSTLDRVCDGYMVRNVYLPLPETQSDYRYLEDILGILQSANVNAMLYKRGANLDAGNGHVISVSNTEYIERSTHPAFLICVSNDTSSVVYTASSVNETTLLKEHDWLKSSSTLIFGSHGIGIKPFSKDTFLYKPEDTPRALIFTSPENMLKNKEFVSYINLLYQNGFDIVLDDNIYYRFELSK